MTQPSTSLFRKLIPGVLFGFLVLVGLALIGDLRQVGEVFSRFNWWIFPLALLFTLFNYGLRFVKFMYYMRLIGAEQIAWPAGLRIFVGRVSPGGNAR